MAATIDCNESAELHNNSKQPIDVDEPHQQLQRRKMPAMRLIMTPRQQRQQRNHHSYCHIMRSNDNNRQMRGKIEQTPTQQLRFHFVVRKMRRRPYRAMRGSAAQICQSQVQQVRQRRYASTPKTVCTSPKSCTLPKASTLSTPKTLCTLPRASMASTSQEVASVEEGQNEPLAKEGNNEPLAKDVDWLSTTMSPLPQRQLSAYVMWGSNKHLTTRTGDRVHPARQQPVVLGLLMHARQQQAPHYNRWLGHNLQQLWRRRNAHN